jgi:Succinylglutamate desuccinylase / Aspartoacylase family
MGQLEPPTLDIAGVSVQPGMARRHALDVVELADGLRVSLPVVLVNGSRPGPRLYLGAAIHGDEINGLAILATALQRIRPESLSGSLVCVMVQNPLAFHVDHRIPIGHYLKSPLDQTPIDPWTCFPGNQGGPLAAMLASPGMDGLLAVAVPATKEGGSASPAAGPPGLDPANGRRESPVGTTPGPGRSRAARIPRVGPDRRQVHVEAL